MTCSFSSAFFWGGGLNKVGFTESLVKAGSHLHLVYRIGSRLCFILFFRQVLATPDKKKMLPAKRLLRVTETP